MKEEYPVSYLKMEVEWRDCDPAGITYYARYFDWFTNGRFKFLKDFGIRHSMWFRKNQIELTVLNCCCRYKHFLTLEDPVTIETYLVSVSKTRMEFRYKILNEDSQLAAEGHSEHAYLNENGKVCNLEKFKPELWNKLSSTFSKHERVIHE